MTTHSDWTSPAPRLDIPRLIGAIVLCQVAGAIGGVATASSVKSWYAPLRKASLNPPPWVFGPVWTILYALMGISLYRASRARAAGPAGAAPGALQPFFLQLSLNAAWSFVFFGARRPFEALITLVALLAAILATIRSFARLDRAAAWLLVPYAVWVTFAGYLNASVWWLNRD